ncbi:MAG: hypothetical protein KGI38_11855 [Thaumarchaeota archaeon]|nr:hypothetical protein [Nitrososphaerota archaeon]
MSEQKFGGQLWQFYSDAYRWVVDRYKDEVDWAESLDFAECTPERFLDEYLWTVITSGLKIEGAGRKLFEKFKAEGKGAIKHPAKRRAVEAGLLQYRHWFERVREMKDEKQILEYLDGLPHVGPVTKYQLAQNIGVPVAKPDIWLVRVAAKFGEKDVQAMCRKIAEWTGHKVRTVDYVIWRYCERGNFQHTSVECPKEKKEKLI